MYKYVYNGICVYMISLINFWLIKYSLLKIFSKYFIFIIDLKYNINNIFLMFFFIHAYNYNTYAIKDNNKGNKSHNTFSVKNININIHNNIHICTLFM